MEHGRRGRCLLFPSADRGQQRYKLPLRHREQRRAVLYVPTAERCDCETVVSLLAPWRDGYSAEWVQVPASAGTRDESTCPRAGMERSSYSTVKRCDWGTPLRFDCITLAPLG